MDSGYIRADFRNLLEVQELDSEIARRRAAIEHSLNDPEVTRLRELVKRAAEAASAAKERVATLKRAISWEEKEADGIREQITSAERKMYGGHVANPKELDQMQKKVEQQRKDLGRHEEAALEAMMELEEAAPELDQADATLARAGEELAKAEAENKATAATLEAEIREIEPRRADAAARVPAGLMSRYEQIRDRRGGLGVAALTPDGLCGACLIKVPAILAETARKGALEVCESCGRLLVGPKQALDAAGPGEPGGRDATTGGAGGGA